MSDAKDALRESVGRAIREHNVKADELTMVQLAESVSQAIECGDFVRHVHVSGNSQALTYIPARQVNELQAQLNTTRENLALAVEALELTVAARLTTIGKRDLDNGAVRDEMYAADKAAKEALAKIKANGGCDE